MRKVVSAALLGGFMTVFALPVLAQGSTPAPTGPSDCKANEVWDKDNKRCKPE